VSCDALSSLLVFRRTSPAPRRGHSHDSTGQPVPTDAPLQSSPSGEVGSRHMTITASVLVTFQSMRNAVLADPRRLEEGAESASQAADIPKAALLGELSHALAVLEAAEKHSGVLVAPDDQATSLLQTYLAKRASEKGSLVQLRSGGLEAKFDSFDIA